MTATLRTTPVYVWVFLLGLFANVFAGNTAYLGLPVGPDRLLLPAAILLAVVDPRAPRIVWRPLYGAMAALTLWTVYSAMSHDTLATTDGFYALLDRIIMPFVLFAVAPMIFARSEDRGLLLRFLVLVTLYLGVTSILEMIGPRSLVFPRYILDTTLGTQTGRARGPFLSSEANGMAMGIGVMASMLLVTRVRGVWRAVSAGAIAVGLAGCILTLTRSIWLGVAGALVVLAWFVPRHRRVVIAAVGGLATLGVAIVAAAPGLTSAVIERATTGRSLYDRQNTNDAALRILNDRPLDGIGWSNFVHVGAAWIRQGDYPITNVAIEVHNVVLSRAAELGIPAAILFVGILVAGPVRSGVTRAGVGGDLATWRILLGCALVIWFVPSMTSPNPYPFPNYLVWLMAGLLGPGAIAAPGVAGSRTPRGRMDRESAPLKQPSPEPLDAASAR